MRFSVHTGTVALLLESHQTHVAFLWRYLAGFPPLNPPKTI
jgi:hypothetical protein